ncbi:MAG: general secretion pathway protein GspK [Candidatus Omnitrophica bacterium]|nr:general secretion pathway protein GspK [Candidatus Omnitrophota bacterium]
MPHAPLRERGIALLIVVSLLTVIGIMGVAFAFSMYLETQASRQFVATTQARYLAEGGVNHAWALLDEDRLGSRVDEMTEAWWKQTAGSDVDVDGDGTQDAKWWLVKDSNGRTVGRYALKIIDEAGKANLNAAQADPSEVGLGAINLTRLLEQANVNRAHEVAEAIERYRDGEDAHPGKAGVDDDHDGAIDEPDEYQPLALVGDDRRLEGVEELASLAGLTEDELRRLARIATTYTWDLNVSVIGNARANVNTLAASELLPVLLEAGVADPWQAAVNMADDVDRDLDISRVTKSSQTLFIPNQGPLGSWTRSNEPVGHYLSQTPNGAALSWSVQVPDGKFRLLARGIEGSKIGDVAIAGQLKRSVSDGESLGMFELSGTLTVEVSNHESDGTVCAFRGLELVSDTAGTGLVVRGVEAIRFNEVMVDPAMEFEVSAAAFDAQGSDWVCPVGSASCSNSGVGQGRWTWTDTLLQPGRYYVRVFGTAQSQTVGEVRVGTTTHLLVDGQYHPSTMAVGSDGKMSLTIGKTNANGTYYVRRITLSLQPDAEYVELINLSGDDIHLGGWTIEGELTGGRQARLPAGSVIRAHGLLVAAVDLDDTQTTLAGNGIDARTAWEIPSEVNAVQLEFPGGAPSPEDDWLKTTVPSGSVSRLILRLGSATVDEVEYRLPLATTASFQSLEKGDPSVIVDQDGDGVDDGWYPSLQLYTPGQMNDNDGMKELKDLTTIVHDPSREITILNRPLEGVGELAGLPSGMAWKPFSSTDLARIVDRLTVEGYRLQAEGHWGGDEVGQAAWAEKADGFYVHTDPQQSEAIGRWQWTGLPDGTYRLSLYGCDGCAGEQFAVRWERQDHSFTQWSPALSTDIQGRLVIGQVTIGTPPEEATDGTPPNTFTIELTCASVSGVCHVDEVRLDPQLIRVGPININTAPLEVLRALPGMTDTLASRLISGRPYGDQEQRGRGIGDLLLGNVLGSDEEEKLTTFKRMAHMLTTRSDLFEIISLGQAMDGEHVQATQRIRTIVQR